MDSTATRRRTSRQRPDRRKRRALRVLGAVTMLTALGALASACSQSPSGPGAASGTSSSSSSGASPPGSAASAGPLALAQCMRAHGVHDFPDPDSTGNFDLSGGGDLNPANPTYQAAAQACRSFGSASKASEPSLSPQQIAATVQFAQCMRAHGVTNYPDPDSSGHIPGVRRLGVDPNSPQFQPAVNACEHYMQGISGWSS